MTAFRSYLENRIVQLALEGQSREASIAVIAEQSGMPADDVAAFFAGDVLVEDMSLCRQMGGALGLDDIEVVEQASEGDLYETYVDIEGGREWMGRRLGEPGQLGTNEFVYATGNIARDHDRIDIASFKTGQYARNAIVLDNHNRLAPVVGKSSRPVRDLKADQISGVISWDMAEDNKRGQQLARQYHEGLLSNVSVWWTFGRNVPFNELPEKDPRYRKNPVKVQYSWGSMERMGKVHFGGTLIEVSAVSVPGDIGAVKKRGLGVDAGQTLRALDWQDPEAAAALRAGMHEVLKDPNTWADEAVRSHLAGCFRHLTLHDSGFRGLLKAVGLTTPTNPTPKSSEEDGAGELLKWAAGVLNRS